MNFTKALRKIVLHDEKYIAMQLEISEFSVVYTFRTDPSGANRLLFFENDRELFCRLPIDLLLSNDWKLIKNSTFI